VVTIPFVQWPGSVVRFGVQEMSKALVFYFFTVAFVRTESDFRKFLAVFVVCQLLRVLEPLYLHFTEDYWGAVASMDNWEYLNRLSGAPSDIVNPNGLAFIVCTTVPFLFFLAGRTVLGRLAAGCAIGLCVYALLLTGSRSGLVGLAVVFIGIVLKSRRPLVVAAFGVLVTVVSIPYMDPDMQDRYLSLIGMGPKNEVTAEGRLEGVENNFQVAFQRPLFGFGLGTSREANANFGASDQPAHNLYAEVAQELGFVGLFIFLGFMRAIEKAYRNSARTLRNGTGDDFLMRVVMAGQVWFWMCIVFSFASYGLSGYEWYLNAGLAVTISLLALRRNEGGELGRSRQRVPNELPPKVESN
jgi:putative inorganic carbon (hco3(-)) transporter